MKRRVILISLILITLMYSCTRNDFELKGIEGFEELQFRTSGPIELNDNTFEGYFVLHDNTKNRIPLILYVSMDILQDERLNAKDSIVNVKTTIIGQIKPNIEQNSDLSEFKDDWYHNMISTIDSEKVLNVSRKHEGAIAFLEEHFPEAIQVESINDSYIEYTSKSLGINLIEITVTRNIYNGKLILEVIDQADVVNLGFQ